MGFAKSGTNLVQSGTDTSSGNTTLLAAMQGVAGKAFLADAESSNNILYVLNPGKKIIVDGTFTDSSGAFCILLTNGASIACRAAGSSFTVGKKEAIGGKAVYSGGGTIIVHPTTTRGYDSSYIHWQLNNSSGTHSSGEFKAYDTVLRLYTVTGNDRQDIYFSEIGGCKIQGAAQGAAHASKYIVLRLKSGGAFDDNEVTGVQQFEFQGKPASFKNNNFVNLSEGFIAFAKPVLIALEAPNFLKNWSKLGWTNLGGLNYIDTQINHAPATESVIKTKQLRAQSAPTETVRGFHFSKTQSEQLIDSKGAAVAARVWFKDNSDAVFTPTVTAGVYAQVIKLFRNTNAVAGNAWAVGVWKHYYPIKKAIYSYAHEYYGAQFANYDSFRTIKGATRLLKADAMITEASRSTVQAYTQLDTAAKLYDYSKHWKESHLELPAINALPLSRQGATIDAGAYDVVIDKTAGALFAFANNTITFKCDKFVDNIQTTGSVSVANGAVHEGAVIGATTVKMIIKGLPAGASARIGIWKKTAARATVTTTTVASATATTISLPVPKNTDYYYILDAVGYTRSSIAEFNTSKVSALTASLQRIVDEAGSAIIPATLTSAQATIANMFTLSSDASKVLITLPLSYATDKRWDATNKLWTFAQSDFAAIAYAVEKIQTSLLAYPYTITVKLYELQIETASQLKIMQASSNLAGATVNMSAFALNRKNDTQRKNTFVDHSNGRIQISNGVPVVVDNPGLPSAQQASITQARDYARQAAANTQAI